MRTEIKKKTGITLNEYGEKIDDIKDDDPDEELQPQKDIQQIKNSKKYTPINSYKPTGKLVYSEDLLNKLETKLN